MSDFWELTDRDKIDKRLRPIADLIIWSSNEEGYTSFNLFLDIIGWSEEAYAHEILDYIPPKARRVRRGFIELEYLADALTCYTERPESVTNYINQVMESN